MAHHSSTLAWKIPWMEEPGRLQSMGLLRVRHDWVTSFSLFLSCIGEGNVNPLQCSCLENPRDKGAWWAAVYGVAQSRTRLMWLGSSSSIIFNDWVILMCVYIHTYVLHPPHSTVSGHLGCFCDLAVVISAAVNLGRGGSCIFSNYSFLWIYAQEWDCRIIW